MPLTGQVSELPSWAKPRPEKWPDSRSIAVISWVWANSPLVCQLPRRSTEAEPDAGAANALDVNTANAPSTRTTVQARRPCVLSLLTASPFLRLSIHKRGTIRVIGERMIRDAEL